MSKRFIQYQKILERAMIIEFLIVSLLSLICAIIGTSILNFVVAVTLIALMVTTGANLVLTTIHLVNFLSDQMELILKQHGKIR